MNILVLNGSPRMHGNTAAMMEAFAEGAQEAGHDVTVMPIGNKNIAGCLACEYCRTKSNGVCTQQDDMQNIYSALKEVEVLVLASPIYYFTLTGQMHCAIQRIYAFDKPPKLKKAALILSSDVGGVYTAAIATYKEAVLGYMGAKDMGIITAYGRRVSRILCNQISYFSILTLSS